VDVSMYHSRFQQATGLFDILATLLLVANAVVIIFSVVVVVVVVTAGTVVVGFSGAT
jgi:hypothetical protein